MDISLETGPDSVRDTSRYTLTVEEASVLFATAGVPRSPRSVQRYCKHSVLDSVVIETGTNEKYLIDPTSVERRITELKQVLQTSGDTSGHNATGRDTTRHDTTGRDERRQQKDESQAKQDLEKKLEEAESEIEILRFDARMSKELTKYVQGQNKDLISQMNEQSRIIGRLETELRIAIEAPKTDAVGSSGSLDTSTIATPAPGGTSSQGDNPVL